MVQLFWKKLTILNIGLFIVFIRLYGLIISTFNRFKNNDSIFPSEAEDGYPFLDMINCNIKQVSYISAFFANETINRDIEPTQVCHYDFISFSKINHGIVNWEEVYSVNDINGKELNVMYKIINGYHTYDNIILYKNDYGKLKEKVTSSQDNMNNLLYLHSLFLKAANILHIKYSTASQQYINQYYNKCLSSSHDDIDILSKYHKDSTLQMINQIEKIFSLVSSPSQIHLQGINAMLKVLFNKSISNKEKESFLYTSMTIYKSLNYLFEADTYLTNLSKKLKQYEGYIIPIYTSIILIITLMSNRYFIKHKEYYNKSGRFFKSHKAYDIKKLQYYKEKQALLNNKQQSKARIRNNTLEIPISECTPEELAMIDRITSKNNQRGESSKSEFVITK